MFGPLWLLLRRRLPREPVVLSRRLWKLVLGLAAMPLCALIAVVLLTFRRYDSIEVNTVAMYQGMVVLPFVFLTSLVLLFAILMQGRYRKTLTLYRDIQNKKSRSTFVWLTKIGKF